MSLIATGIEPHGATRIFFDRLPADPDRHDEVRIARAIEEAAIVAVATASAEPPELPRAA